MNSEPRFLDLEDELYPQVLMLKQIIFSNQIWNELIQYNSEIKYNSFKREIDLTPIILRYFIQNSSKFEPSQSKNSSYEILIQDQNLEKWVQIGIFPHDYAYILGQQFLSSQILHIVVKPEFQEPSPEQLYQQQYQHQQQQKQPSGLFPFSQLSQQKPQNTSSFHKEEDSSQDQKPRPNKRRTISQILHLVAQWRKLMSVKKLSAGQAAGWVKMSKRSLQDYFSTIKLAEKYGFDFEGSMQHGFGQLRNFVKLKHETKITPKLEILQKFNPHK